MSEDTRKDKPAATVNARLRRDHTNTMRYRLSKQTRPHYLLAGLAAGGATLGQLAAVTDPATVAGTVLAAGAAGTGARWLARRGKPGRPGSVRQLAAGLAATCWCGWVAAAGGIDWTATAVLAVGGYAAALGWWRRHRLPDPPETLPPVVVEDDPNDPALLWAEHIGGKSGDALPGSSLSGAEPIPTGVRYLLHLVPGRQTLAAAQNALPKLRTGLRLRRDQDLILEPHPDTDESIIRLTIVRQSRVLQVAQPWPGPAYNPSTGNIVLGPYVDGEGSAEWLLASDNRLYGGFVVGSTGSGKSRLLEALALGAAGGAGTVVWFGDPQGGASSPFLAGHADWVARDPKGIAAMLEAARKLKRLRQVENAYHEWEGWTPSQPRRGLLLVIDESHGPMADEKMRAAATELAREGGKVGIALVLASQVPTLDAFGGSEALRSNVCAGNVVLMRIKSKQAKSVLPGVDVDPSGFPRVPGYGFLVDDTGTRRSAPFRGFYLDDQTRDHAAAQVAWPELDTMGTKAVGGGYQHRREREQSDKEALGAALAALARGEDVPALTAARPVLIAAAGPKVHPFPTWPPASATSSEQATAPEAGDGAGPRTAVEAVHELLAAGITSPKELRERSQYSEKSVENALQKLAERGQAQRVKHGVWRLTDA